MQGFSQVWWTEAKSGGFSRLPLLWATNIDTEGEIEEKKGGISTPSPPLSIRPERKSTHLGISVVRSNK